MKKQRLLKGADFMDELPRKSFEFSKVVDFYDEEKECGTVCCFMGWTPVIFPHLMEWVRDRHNNWDIKFKDGNPNEIWYGLAADLFNISEHDAYILFTPYDADMWSDYKKSRLKELGLSRLGVNATPKAVAKNIRRYVEAMS